MLSSDNLINSAIQYNSTNPQNLKEGGYSDFDILDFKLSGPGRCLVGGSVRLLFDVQVLNNNNVETKCSYDAQSGGHSWIESVNVSAQNFGMVEQIRFYQRQVACRARAILAKEDLFNSSFVAEGRCCDEVISDKLLKGFIPTAFADNEYDGDVTKPLDVCLDLDFCLNSFLGNNLLPFDKTGDLTISISLPRSASCLWGNDTIGGAQTYKLTNVKLLYNTVQDSGKNGKSFTMVTRSDFKQTISSSFATISSMVPITASSFYMNFIRSDMENNSLYNSMQCQVLPAVNRVTFAWNDSQSQQITYQLENAVDYLNNFKAAISGTTAGSGDITLVENSANESFGLGLNFGSYVNLAQNKLSISIESAVQSGVPYTCYVHVVGVLSI